MQNSIHTMKTTFEIEPTSLVNKRRANTACSTISAAVRFLFKPILITKRSSCEENANFSSFSFLFFILSVDL